MLAAVLCLLAACGVAVDVSGNWALRVGACRGTITLAQSGRKLIGTASFCGVVADVRGTMNSNEIVLGIKPLFESTIFKARLAIAGGHGQGFFEEDDSIEMWFGAEPEPPTNKPRSDVGEDDLGA